MESQAYKYTGAFLAAVFVMMSVSLLSDVIFDSPKPEKEGYNIQPLETAAATPEKPAAAAVPIATLLQNADPKKGETVFKRCLACHSGEKGGPNKVGPHLWDIVNRPIASVSDFSYSAAMKEFAKTAKVWDYEHLNGFLTSPKTYVKGTAMGFAGDKNDQERADLIAYLRTLADNPAPLPAAEDAKPAEGEPAKPATETEKPENEGGQPGGGTGNPAGNVDPTQGEQPAPAAPAGQEAPKQ
ncbi:cysteine desulfurase [Brucella endophytica]|uniref:Cysteine desulfurase n=1 Tax=Brucella endophytica TaxID=1963359 RepID=A0A916WDQ4_9HYPH|nr:cytochrome c family protein [Brucella endophytica]GGA89197.1 cysteine desulfurase [Brucella endophytica]